MFPFLCFLVASSGVCRMCNRVAEVQVVVSDTRMAVPSLLTTCALCLANSLTALRLNTIKVCVGLCGWGGEGEGGERPHTHINTAATYHTPTTCLPAYCPLLPLPGRGRLLYVGAGLPCGAARAGLHRSTRTAVHTSMHDQPGGPSALKAPTGT
jgi:hypothetical protein